ncbi:MAG: hypothetical protein RIS29_2392 [Bacteroidota bacterium]|jgi:hypothetical protein
MLKTYDISHFERSEESEEIYRTIVISDILYLTAMAVDNECGAKVIFK